MSNTSKGLSPVFNLSKFDIMRIVKEDVNQLKVAYVKPQNVESAKTTGILKVMPANKWMQLAKDQAIPKMLFDELWHEGEINFMYADSNLGKSILAVQIADSISRGIAISGFKLEAEAQPVIYFDFELSVKQFENRYSIDYTHPYTFSDNFLRAELDPDAEVPDGFKGFEDYLIHCIEQTIKERGVKVLIIDNITFLGTDHEKAKETLPLMKQLKRLKEQYGLSILILAHTPKRDSSRPLTLNDIHGSKMLANFIDSAFAIGKSHMDEGLRYIKQIKERQKGKAYGEDNVCVCRIAKPENFVQFEFVGYGQEWQHLKPPSEDDRAARSAEVKKLSQQGMTQRAIADKLGIGLGTVNNLLKS